MFSLSGPYPKVHTVGQREARPTGAYVRTQRYKEAQ